MRKWMGIAVVLVLLTLIGFVFLRHRTLEAPTASSPVHFDRIVLLVLENYRSDKVDPASIPSNSFLTKLASENRFASNYYGVWKLSLPNYIAMIGGDTFDVRNDHDSCFSPDHKKRCNGIDALNLVDQLEEKNISWEGLFESMPSAGFLGTKFPKDRPLYVQKHNPFVYFRDIALDNARLAKLKPFQLSDLKAQLADSASASRFIFLVPNLCNDEHGAHSCRSNSAAAAAGNAFLAKVVPVIIDSPGFTERSVLFVTWDNSHGNEACCGAWPGGGRIPFIAVTKHRKRVLGSTPANHVSLLATIEDSFGLPRLGTTKDASTLFDLFPDLVEGRQARIGR